MTSLLKIVNFLGCGPGRKLDDKMAVLVFNVAFKWEINCCGIRKKVRVSLDPYIEQNI